MEKHLLDPERTPEEVRANVDRFLELNSRPLRFCIVCKNQITKNQSLVETPHGDYHGFPMTCIDGREEEEGNHY